MSSQLNMSRHWFSALLMVAFAVILNMMVLHLSSLIFRMLKTLVYWRKRFCSDLRLGSIFVEKPERNRNWQGRGGSRHYQKVPLQPIYSLCGPVWIVCIGSVWVLIERERER